MTICEKFKLMMASFADIKAAIIEKGVPLQVDIRNMLKIYAKYILMKITHQNINILPKNRR